MTGLVSLQLCSPKTLLDCFLSMLRWVVAGRCYAFHAFREHVRSRGASPAIPPKRNEAPVACPDWAYANRNQVERLSYGRIWVMAV